MKSNKKILMLCKYSRMGGSSRLRSFQYIPYIRASGFDVTVDSFFDDEYLSRRYLGDNIGFFFFLTCYLKRLYRVCNVTRYHVIWIEKEIFPYLPAFVERALWLFGKKYVVDYDDAIFHYYEYSSNKWVRRLLKNKIDTVIRLSGCVTVGNRYLDAKARSFGAGKVVTIPTVLDATRYCPKRHQDEQENECLVIGWVGSPTTQKYVIDIRHVLASVCQRFGARLLLVGATAECREAFPDTDVSIVPWTEAAEADLIRGMDVGIMPLADGPWEKGKCGYKIIQYMACAVPVVASPVGANVDIVDQCESGLLAGNDDEWEAALAYLLSSCDQRRDMGMAGRDHVENYYSLDVQAAHLVAAINDL